MKFVVIVQRDLAARAFGPYRSFKRADADARNWDGFVLPVETPNASEPWNARAVEVRGEQ